MHSISQTQPVHRKFFTFFLLLLLLFIFPTILAAAPPKERIKDEKEPQPSIETLETLDSYRDTASRQVTRFANWVDNFFADDRIYDEKQGSYIKLNVLQTYFENGDPIYDAQIKAKLDIPKTQKRLQLFIVSVDEDESDAQQTSIDKTVEKQEQSIGLQFFNPDLKLWKVTTIAGVRIHSGLDPFARLKFRRLIEKEFWTYRFTESIFWFESDGAGETTRLDMDRRLTKKLLFRSTTQATWKNINHYFDTGQDLIIFQNINKHKSLAYQLGTRGIIDSRVDPQVYATDYFLSVRYRQQMHKKWLYLDIIPSINHPRENDYKPVRSITLKLEIVFDAK